MEVFQSAGSSAQRGKILIFLSVVLLFAASCKKNVDTVVETGFDYIPVVTGNYIIYHIDSIYFDDFAKKSDTFSFQLKELFGEPFTDLSGNTSYELKRYTRIDTGNADALPWKLKNVWYVTKLTDRYERVEESFRYSCLKFPMSDGATWNGNAFNSNEEWDYTYMDVYKSFTDAQSSNQWDSTVTVIEIDDENKIDKKYYKDVYAKYIGLVYRKVIDIESTDYQSTKPIMERITKGVIYEERYVSHGTN